MEMGWNHLRMEINLSVTKYARYRNINENTLSEEYESCQITQPMQRQHDRIQFSGSTISVKGVQ